MLFPESGKSVGGRGISGVTEKEDPKTCNETIPNARVDWFIASVRKGGFRSSKQLSCKILGRKSHVLFTAVEADFPIFKKLICFSLIHLHLHLST